ncbi:guanylin-like precursor [Callorhinchus milii]|uniref:Guanylin n=1 Tax=Callorhinchus milii TaxID=7868 RepID=K4FYR2_CALMI|nr:guanylin-like precursor [Callorhinchus milii]AFK11597.1 guanylin precursor [Callorhinchus milii]|eukprot:gi/632960108/ref/XP_007896007.1/ PREDICTED: guanylin-like [Callorhinchus milii]
MKFLLASVLLISCLSSISESAVVRIGANEFSLEEVTQLKDLMDEETIKMPCYSFVGTSTLCNNPALPEKFKPLCSKGDAPQIFCTLGQIAAYPYACEICSYSACAGCF